MVRESKGCTAGVAAIWDHGLKCCWMLGTRASPHWVWPNPGWSAQIICPGKRQGCNHPNPNACSKKCDITINYMRARSANLASRIWKIVGLVVVELQIYLVSNCVYLQTHPKLHSEKVQECSEALSFSTTASFYNLLLCCELPVFQTHTIPLIIYQLYHGRNQLPIPTELYLFFPNKNDLDIFAFVAQDQYSIH